MEIKKELVFVLIGIIILVLVLVILRNIFSGILYGIFLAYFLKPIQVRLEKYMRPKFAAALSIGLLAPIIILFLLYLIYIMNMELNYLLNDNLTSQFELFFNSEIADLIANSIQNFANLLLSQLTELIATLVLFLFNAFVGVIVGFYFLSERKRTFSFILSFFPISLQSGLGILIKKIDDTIMSLIKGHVWASVIIGIIGWLGFYILNVPYALILGLLTGLFTLIPILGPTLFGLPIVLYYIFIGDYIRAIFILILVLFLADFPELILRPYLAGVVAKIHPIFILVFLVGGTLTYGISGFILGIIMLAIAKAFYEYYVERIREKLLTN